MFRLFLSSLSPTNACYKPSDQHQKQQGFTLVELMIVVAIIGVLSAIAVPIYKNYVKKSELTAAVATLKNLVTPAELYYQENGDLTTTTSLAMLGTSSDASDLGTLSINANNSIQMVLANRPEVTLTLARQDTGWVCTSTGIEDSEKPKGC